jgi:trimeric autotransporter adhesin
MNGLTDVLKSPSVWTGKDGVAGVTDLLKNSPLQDKIQFGLMKSSFDTLVKTGEIVTPGTNLKAPTGLLYNAAANAGKSLISPTAGLVELPKELGSIASGSLSSLTTGLASALSGATGALSGALSGATGALSGATGALGSAVSGITSNLGSVSSLANNGTAQLGGLLANASKFGVGTAVEWAKSTSGATSAIAGISGALSGGASGVANVVSGGIGKAIGGATGALSGAIGGAAGAIGGITSKLTSGLTTQMDSLAKQGEFAVNFSDTKLPSAVAGIVPAAGFKGTIDRSTLDAATAKLVGSDKIALSDFSPQAVDTSALTDAASKAKGLLAGGLDAAGALARAGGAGGLGSITGSINGAVNTATSALSSVTGGAAGAVSGALGKLPYTGTDSITLARLGLSPDPLTAIKSRLG